MAANCARSVRTSVSLPLMKVQRLVIPTLAAILVLPCVFAAAARPNIIVIFTDDHGYADLGVQGSVSDIKTPNIDALAHDGVRFKHGYVSAPQCIPSRAGMLTGRYQQRFGIDDNK